MLGEYFHVFAVSRTLLLYVCLPITFLAPTEVPTSVTATLVCFDTLFISVLQSNHEASRETHQAAPLAQLDVCRVQ